MRCLILSLLSCLIATVTAQTFPALNLYQSPTSGLSFGIPQGWEVASDEAQGIIEVYESYHDPSSPALFWYSAPQRSGQSLEAAVSAYLQSIQGARILQQESFNNGAGLRLLASATVNGVASSLALIAFSDQASNTINLTVFRASQARFEALGGMPLLLVTFGGQDPSLYQTDSTQPQASQAGTQLDSYCYDQQSVLYTSDYCNHGRLFVNRQAVPTGVIQGAWSYAISTLTGNVGQNVLSGEYSYDGSGYGMILRFKPDASYEMIYLYNGTFNFCSNKVEAYEQGRYQFDGNALVLTLQPSTFEANLKTCYQEQPTRMTETNLPSDQLELAFSADQQTMAITFRCREYMISCADDGYLRLTISRDPGG